MCGYKIQKEISTRSPWCMDCQPMRRFFGERVVHVSKTGVVVGTSILGSCQMIIARRVVHPHVCKTRVAIRGHVAPKRRMKDLRVHFLGRWELAATVLFSHRRTAMYMIGSDGQGKSCSRPRSKNDVTLLTRIKLSGAGQNFGRPTQQLGP